MPRPTLSRACPAILFFCAVAASLSASVESTRVDFAYVRDLAAKHAAAAYVPPDTELPSGLQGLSYDDYRNIRFRPDQALWKAENLPFRLEFFHRGGFFHEKVTLQEFRDDHTQEIPFLREFFSYDLKKNVGWLRSSLGYAGFRVHYPLNVPNIYDEVIAFLGKSYFRAVGTGQVYGLSARGVTIDCGLPGLPEEFPSFTEFWIGKPLPNATTLTVYALLDGPSVNGAFEFIITPGKPTVLDVHAVYLFRRHVQLPGFAPFTSMFWYGENSDRPAGQPRPEVHDSDGLLVYDGGSRLWHPLDNPRMPQNTEVPVKKLERFGLIQRDRAATSYEDLEAFYHRRPSAWVEPRGDWGPGSVRLVELPGRETDDNIVAFWVPAKLPEPGTPLDLRYRIVWSLDEPDQSTLARVVATHAGTLPDGTNGRLFWIDFADAKAGSRDPDMMHADVQVSDGVKLRPVVVMRYPEIGGWRVALQLETLKPNVPQTIRCQLQAGRDAISETWMTTWRP